MAGGDKKDKQLYDNLSSPTVSLEALLATIAIAAVERNSCITLMDEPAEAVKGFHSEMYRRCYTLPNGIARY